MAEGKGETREMNSHIIFFIILSSVSSIAMGIIVYEGHRAGEREAYIELKSLTEAKYDLLMYHVSSDGFSEQDYNSTTKCFVQTSLWTLDNSTGWTQFNTGDGQYSETISAEHILVKKYCSAYYSELLQQRKDIDEKLRSLE